jgi:hypothetical protein
MNKENHNNSKDAEEAVPDANELTQEESEMYDEMDREEESREFEQLIEVWGLQEKLSRDELGLFFRLGDVAKLAKDAMNSPKGLGQSVKAKALQDSTINNVEVNFMDARQALLNTSGWKNLPEGVRQEAEKLIFAVFVDDENMAD